MDEPLPIDVGAMQSLGQTLRRRLEEYIRERRATEQQWVRNLRQYLGKYDPELEQRIEEGRSKAYPKLTRVKVVSMVSRLMALLFPTGEKNWGLKASPQPSFDVATMQAAIAEWVNDYPEQQFDMNALTDAIARYATKQANKAERLIDDQLQTIGGTPEVDYVALVRKVVFSAVLYSCGVLKGPMTVTRNVASATVQNGQVLLSTAPEYQPYFEFVPIWDYYPDMSAKDFASMDGQFERHVMSRHQVRQLADRPDFMRDRVLEYLSRNQTGNWRRREFENELRSLSSADNVNDTGRKYELFSFTGYLSGSDLRAAGVQVADDALTDDFEAVVWMIDDWVIKVSRSPYPQGMRTYHQFVFEDDEVNLTGSGLPPIMRDSQLGVCSSTRMLIDNASVVAGPQLEVDLDMLRADQDRASIRPFKVWYKESGIPGETAVRAINLNSHIPELISIIDMFSRMADTETFVSPSTGGDMENAPSEPLRTTAGASMILGNSALPFRDIVRNFDQFTMSVIGSLYQWNLMFRKDAGIHGDMQPVARGATSLIAKEVRGMALDNLATTLREEETPYIDFGALAKARVAVRDLPTETLMVSQAEANRRIQAGEEQARADAALNRQVVEAQIKETLSAVFKNMAQGQKNLDGAQTATFNAAVAALEKGVDPSVAAEYVAGPDAGGPQGNGTPPPAA